MMMGATMSDSMLRHGVVMTPEERQGHIDAYDLAPSSAGLAATHQVGGIDQRRLVNSWGRVADFRYMRLQPHLTRRRATSSPSQKWPGSSTSTA